MDVENSGEEAVRPTISALSIPLSVNDMIPKIHHFAWFFPIHKINQAGRKDRPDNKEEYEEYSD